MRVRLVYETEVEPGSETEMFDRAADALEQEIGGPGGQYKEPRDIFKSMKILRPFTRKPGVTYGRPKKQSDV